VQQVALTDGVQLPAFVSANLFAFALVLCRVGPFFLLAPVLSANLLPARAKFAAAAAISVALAPIAAQGRAPLPQDPVGLGITFAQEIGVGLALALALSVLAAAVSAGASLVDTLVGFSFGSLVDPITGVNASVVGQVYTLFAMMILVVTGGIELMIMGLARSYDMIPIGTFPAPSQLGQLAVTALTQIPLIGLELVGPVILAVVVVDAAFGLVARAVPQMNVFVIGLPVKVIVAFVVIAATLPFVGIHVADDLQHAIEQSLSLLATG
jgi:flagellar biosynthetic protein FliR